MNEYYSEYKNAAYADAPQLNGKCWVRFGDVKRRWFAIVKLCNNG